MKLLVINAGSSSLKSSLFEAQNSKELSSKDLIFQSSVDGIDFENGFDHLFKSLCDKKSGAISDYSEIDIVGHRVVHGSTKYSSPVLINSDVVSDLRSYVELAPDHELANITGIEKTNLFCPQAKQIAVFDTAFHHQMPEASKIYAGPYEWYTKYGIQRFGFHGISHQYASQTASKIADRNFKDTRIISCHLGAGGSLCAIKNGASIMTTMGYTPLEGLIMATRSGSIDPGIIFHLIHKGIYSADQLMQLLNSESGLKGVSGLSGDMKEIIAESSQGNKRAILALDMYVQSVSSGIASLLPLLGGCDLLVFTGGIGENSPLIRQKICKRLNFLAICLDQEKNELCHTDSIISAPESSVQSVVIHARENLEIARQSIALLS